MNITLFVEHLCNLRCNYCYTGEKARRTMSNDVIEASIELALSDSPRVVQLSFFGGEPLLRRELLEFAIERFQSRFAELGDGAPKLETVLNTNATLVDDDVIRWMCTHEMVANVSLDGPQHVHDRERVDVNGRGSYAATRAGLLKLQDGGVRFQLNAVVSPSTARQMDETVEELFRYQSFRQTLSPDLSASWSDAAVSDFHAGAVAAAGVWAGAFRAGNKPQLEPFQTKVLSHVLGGCATAGRCSLALREITVAPSGYLYACAQMVGEDRDSTYRLGHVTTGVEDAAIDRARQAQEGVVDICADCDLRTRCSADCGCRQIAASGALGAIDGILCDTEEAFIAAADQVASELFEEKTPTFIDLIYGTRWKLKEGAQLTQLRRARDA